MPESASFEQRLSRIRSLLAAHSGVPPSGVDLTAQRQRLEHARTQVVARLREATDRGDQPQIDDLRQKARTLAQKIALMTDSVGSSALTSGAATEADMRRHIVEFLAWVRDHQAPLSVEDRAELQAAAAALVRKRRETLQAVETSLQKARKHALQGVVLIRDLRAMVDDMPGADVVTGVRRLPFEPQRQVAANQFSLSKQAVASATGFLRALAAQWPELRACAELPDWSALPFDELMSTLVPSGELTSPVEASRLAMQQRLRVVDDLGAATALWLSELLSRTAALPGPGLTSGSGPESAPHH